MPIAQAFSVHTQSENEFYIFHIWSQIYTQTRSHTSSFAGWIACCELRLDKCVKWMLNDHFLPIFHKTACLLFPWCYICSRRDLTREPCLDDVSSSNSGWESQLGDYQSCCEETEFWRFAENNDTKKPKILSSWNSINAPVLTATVTKMCFHFPHQDAAPGWSVTGCSAYFR